MSSANEKRFAELYKEHYNSVFRYVFRMSQNGALAEDMTQECFINVFNSLDSFDPKRGNFKTWAYTIARNLYYLHLRRQKRYNQDELNDINLDSFASGMPSLEENYDKKNLQNEIFNAILCLPEPEKSIVIYKKLQDKTLQDTADILNLSERTIRRRLLKAFELLKEEFIRRGIAPESGFEK